MSGEQLLLDTNAVLLILGSDKEFHALEGKQIAVSFVTELELYSYPALTREEERIITFFLRRAAIIDITQDIKKLAIALRKKHGLKLPDAIICATAMSLRCPLVSNDKRLKKVKDLCLLTLAEI